MKKIIRKISSLLILAMLFVMVSTMNTAFAADKTMNITLRIEGIEKNLFYTTVKVPYKNTLTLENALTYIDTQEDSIKITGVESGYITDINGETAGNFGGWDGWLYKVNDKDPSEGINNLQLSDGDNVLLYYGDPYGVGMQFPVADTSDIKAGKITFTSSDTKFDADGNPVVSVNPVVGATVIFSNGDITAQYVTDKKGQITIDEDQLSDGLYGVQIAKVGDTKLPLVLRFAPDYTINIDSTKTTSSSGTMNETTTGSKNDTITDSKDDTTSVIKDNSITGAQNDTTGDTSYNTCNSISSVKGTTNQVAKTGESFVAGITFFILAMAALTGFIYLGRKKNYEK